MIFSLIEMDLMILLSSLICLSSFAFGNDPLDYEHDFRAFTVATSETDGFREFLRSTKVYNVPLEVLGFGSKWTGGDMNFAGGGYKIKLLQKALLQYKKDKNRIVLFTDSYDVLYLSGVANIVKKFLSFDARIVFSAESWLWPDRSLEDKFPDIKDGYRFLNSGGFIGYADSVYKLVKDGNLEDTTDDQLFFINHFLNQTLRNELNIKLDTEAEIFQNLNGAKDDVILSTNGGKIDLLNVKFNTKPAILHGNGWSKEVEFRSLSNYLAGRWSPIEGCKDCHESTINLDNLLITRYPRVVFAVFIDKPTPFFEEFLMKALQQNYPRNKIDLFVYNTVPYHQEELVERVEALTEHFHSVKMLLVEDEVNSVTARHSAMDYCKEMNCDLYFNVDSEVHLDNENTLISLIQTNRSVVAPMLVRPFQKWSNFWGTLDKEGYYMRSFDYMEIINRTKVGLWNVPYISGCYLINATVLRNPYLKPDYSNPNIDYDMSFCYSLRKKGVYMYVDNRDYFGHLVDADGFNISNTNPDLYELSHNRFDWEIRYIHKAYPENFNPNKELLQPCPDVYWFPVLSPRFCEEFIEIMENFGQWSDGSNNDNRLQGGYEAVPTRDIHMNQVGLEKQWLEFLRLYVMPLQQLVFIGYSHDPPRSLMNFVVRYKPDEQPRLRPHHDSSTYTINIALNVPGVDYVGGGCRFLRYNCSVTNMKLGWMLMHPGRLTHYHEGLLVTEGIRYIMISFVDP